MGILQILIYSFVTGTQVLLLALALFLVYAVSKVFNFALGAMGAVVGYAVYVSLQAGLPVWGTVACALCTALVLGAINFALNEPFTKKHEYILALLTSFAFSVALEQVLAIMFGSGGKNLSTGVLPVYALGAYQIPLSGLLIIGLGAFAGIASFFLFRCTPWRRSLRAVSENSFAAMSLGINDKAMRFWVYLLAGVVAGLIGILSGFNTTLMPTMGFQTIIMAFIAFLVGGVSDVKGTVIASYVVALVPGFIIGVSPNVSSNWQMVIVFIIAFVLLAFRPNGLFFSRQRES